MRLLKIGQHSTFTHHKPQRRFPKYAVVTLEG
jgi:hypothetical protein